MARIIQSHPEYSAGMSVVLWSCNVVNGSYPQELANILRVSVTAADACAYYPSNGDAPYPYNNEIGGGAGNWVTFQPK